MLSLFFTSMAVMLSLSCVNAQAQTPPTAVKPSDSAQLPPIRVTAKHNKPRPAPTKPATAPAAAASAQASPSPPYVTGAPNIAGGAAVPPTMASQMTVTGQELNARPVARPGEILEAVPGLAVVMHADGGKANQYYLRGYNLDHGTDLAIFVDDMPINLPSHAHGQGYADLNWLMPQTVGQPEHPQGTLLRRRRRFRHRGLAVHQSARQRRQDRRARPPSAASTICAISAWARQNSAAARCSMPAR